MSLESIEQQKPAGVAPMDEVVRRSVAHCREVTRQRARNFFYGLKLTPEPQRSAMYAIYAFMRACDDLADQPVEKSGKVEPAASAAEIEATLGRIEEFRRQMVSVFQSGQVPADLAGEPMWPAFAWTIRSYPVRIEHLHGMLDGQRLDLVKHRYQTFNELYDYCVKVAGLVGQVCISIWGAGDSRPVQQLAEYRGIALQLTNILRDLVEDARRDRVYLPAEELARFGYSPEGLAQGQAGEAFDRMITFQIERARSYYEMSQTLESHLAPSCRPTSWAMMRIYRGLLEKIAQNPRRVLSGRVRLSSLQKAMIALRATWKKRAGGISRR